MQRRVSRIFLTLRPPSWEARRTHTDSLRRKVWQRSLLLFFLPRRGCNLLDGAANWGGNWRSGSIPRRPANHSPIKNRKDMEKQKIRILKKGIERKFNSKTAKHSNTQGCVVEACGELMYLNEIVMIPSFSGFEVVAHAIWIHPETGSALSILLRLRDGDSIWAGEIVDGKGKKVFNFQIEKYI